MVRLRWNFRIKKSLRREASQGPPAALAGVPAVTADGLPLLEQVASDRAVLHPAAPAGPGAEDEWLEQVRASGL